MKRSPNPHQRDTEERDVRPANARTKESRIDQALADSFPASDAPPWTRGVAPARSTAPRNRRESEGELDRMTD